MRSSRIRYDREESYYHLMNRVAGDPDHLPFGDVEKEHFFQLVEQLNRFYAVEPISLVVMSNHWHVAIWAKRRNPCPTPESCPNSMPT